MAAVLKPTGGGRMTTDDADYLTSAELMRRYRCTHAALGRWRRGITAAGGVVVRLPHLKVGGKYLYARADVEAWLAAQNPDTGAAAEAQRRQEADARAAARRMDARCAKGEAAAG